MKRIERLIVFLITTLFAFTGNVLNAQDLPVVPEGYVLADSVVYIPAAPADTALIGRDIFAEVNVRQSPAVENAVRSQIASNADRGMNGYRVRIFFDNRQSARIESEEALKRFEGLYHDIVAYRTYANPYFKVTVGDFRTRSEAVRCLERIRHEFPSAFVVKENISYPVVDKENAYIVDTVQVLRPVASR